MMFMFVTVDCADWVLLFVAATYVIVCLFFVFGPWPCMSSLIKDCNLCNLIRCVNACEDNSNAHKEGNGNKQYV